MLLEQMGLKKLQENFMTERVTGEILLECDDEVLYQELKVQEFISNFRLFGNNWIHILQYLDLYYNCMLITNTYQF